MKPILTGTFSVTILRAFCRALDIDVQQALPTVGAGRLAHLDGDDRVPLDVAFRLFDAAPHLAGVSEAGLAAATRTAMGDLGIMDLLCRAAPTIGATLARVQPFYALLDDP